MDHIWYVRKGRNTVWHRVALPIRPRERENGIPANSDARAACGAQVGIADFWSWSDQYFGGGFLPVCGRCKKAEERAEEQRQANDYVIRSTGMVVGEGE